MKKAKIILRKQKKKKTTEKIDFFVVQQGSCWYNLRRSRERESSIKRNGRQYREKSCGYGAPIPLSKLSSNLYAVCYYYITKYDYMFEKRKQDLDLVSCLLLKRCLLSPLIKPQICELTSYSSIIDRFRYPLKSLCARLIMKISVHIILYSEFHTKVKTNLSCTKLLVYCFYPKFR